METKIDNYSDKISSLTCKLSRVCYEKDTFFASSFNLTPTEIKFLRLFENSNKLSIKQISEELDLTRGRITHLLTSLGKKNLILRESDTKDKRNGWVRLTSKSESFVKNLKESNQRLHDTILSYLDKSKQVEVVDALENLLEAVKKWKTNL